MPQTMPETMPVIRPRSRPRSTPRTPARALRALLPALPAVVGAGVSLAVLVALAAVLPGSATAQEPVSFAAAVLHPTEGNEARGTVRFREVLGGVWIDATVDGLPGPRHAYHVHLYGDCSAPDGTSAGTHLNFHGSSLNPPEGIDRITGDLGELEPTSGGRATHSALIEGATLRGPSSIVGRAIIVHGQGNDHSQPPIGAAGPRLACGVIGIADAPGGP